MTLLLVANSYAGPSAGEHSPTPERGHDNLVVMARVCARASFRTSGQDPYLGRCRPYFRQTEPDPVGRRGQLADPVDDRVRPGRDPQRPPSTSSARNETPRRTSGSRGWKQVASERVGRLAESSPVALLVRDPLSRKTPPRPAPCSRQTGRVADFDPVGPRLQRLVHRHLPAAQRPTAPARHVCATCAIRELLLSMSAGNSTVAGSRAPTRSCQRNSSRVVDHVAPGSVRLSSHHVCRSARLSAGTTLAVRPPIAQVEKTSARSPATRTVGGGDSIVGFRSKNARAASRIWSRPLSSFPLSGSTNTAPGSKRSSRASMSRRETACSTAVPLGVV